MRRDRVTANTGRRSNRDIEARIRESVHYHARHPHRIATRLDALDAEWDVERVLEANAATLAFTGTSLAALHDRRWLVVPAVVTAFLLQHAVQGWCPPLPLLRRMGVRTRREIEAERTALKALRGDFAAVEPHAGDSHRAAGRALAAARA